MHSRRPLRLCRGLAAPAAVAVLLCRSATPAGSAPVAATPWARLVCPFEQSVHGCEGAANPFAAAGNVELVDLGPGQGHALQLNGHDPDTTGRPRLVKDKSALVYDGANLPTVRGTVGVSVRWTGQRNWADGKRTWLMVLVPRCGECMTPIDDDGTALALIKERDGTLAAAAYQFHDGRLTLDFRSRKSGYDVADPDSVVARLSAETLRPRDWVRVRLAWDRESGRVWLGAGKQVVLGQLEFRPARFHCLLLGAPPNIHTSSQIGFDGQFDDLVVDARTPEQVSQAGLALPDPLPPAATPDPGKIEASLLKNDASGAEMESVIRSHLAQVIRAQHPNGGWSYTSAVPSGMSFLSSSTLIPFTEQCFAGSKDGNSAYCALMLACGYRALGDSAWLQSAERTARTLLRLQAPDGHWPYSARYDAEADSFSPMYSDGIAPLEDHVQSHPTCLLWLLHELTGDESYKQAADKGRDFILRAQNPNGSWSHHFDLAQGCGQAARRQYLRAGEINDDTTGDQMMVMLVAYRRTGDPRYLASYLRAADWLVSAFIDRGGKGWAQQYDEQNNPIPARHFEPAAVSLSEGIHSAPRMLMRAYRLTGEERYATPVRKWYEWMMAKRVFLDAEKTRWGWYAYYDVDTGEPFRMFKNKRLPPDPRTARDGGYSSVLREIERLDRPAPAPETAERRAKRLLAAEEKAKAIAHDPVATRLRPMSLVQLFDWDAGTWLFNHGPSGPSMSPATIRVALMCWSVFIRRQIAGQIPWDHPLATLERVQWGSPFYQLLPPQELDRRLAPEELTRAREE